MGNISASVRSMWAECLVVLLCSAVAHSQHPVEESTAMDPWWNSMLGFRSLEPRSVRNVGRQEKFWATRGKRGDMFFKPNGLFSPLNGKRNTRTVMKPNGFFMMGKRGNGLAATAGSPVLSLSPGTKVYGFKPNGLFASFDDKRSLSLKPNGIFSLTKRSYGGTPYHKRYIKPNGFFSIAKRGYGHLDDYELDYDEDFDFSEEEEEFMPTKRENEDLMTSKVDRIPELFWATRG